MNGSRAFGLGVAALGCVYFALAVQLPMHTLNGPGAGVFPVLVSGVLVATGLLAAWRPERAVTLAGEEDVGSGSFQAVAIVLAALVGFCLLLPRAGYVVSGVLLMTAVLRAFKAGWGMSLTISAISVAATYVVFVPLLGLTLPRGMWWG